MSSTLTYGETDSVKKLRDISTYDTSLLPRHRWYPLKEGFSPSLVLQAIKDSQCNSEDIIIDPFSGSGTVPVTALVNGYNSIGFEVNPFLAFVSKTKLQTSRANTVKKHLDDVMFSIEKGHPSPLESFSTFSDGGNSNKWLFNREILRAFEGGWKGTIGKQKTLRDIFRLALIRAALDNANAAKDGKCLRYKKHWRQKNYNKDQFLNSFQSRIHEIQTDLEECPAKNIQQPSIYLCDSRDPRNYKRLARENKKFKLCIMSPPYLNSFDYTDVYRPELFIGKFIHSNEELYAHRLKTLRSHVQAIWDNPKNTIYGKHFSEAYEKIKERTDSLWHKRIPEMIQAYFEDICKVLTNLKTIALPDSSIWIVVSTSAYAGVEIPVDLIIADIGTQTGWFLREVSVNRYLKRFSGQQWAKFNKNNKKRPYLRESIIILDNSPKRTLKGKMNLFI